MFWRTGWMTMVLGLTLAHTMSLAATPRGGKDRPITQQWTCETGRSLQLNFNPRRMREEAWLTYGGNRAEVYRLPGVERTYASKDGKVKWTEGRDEGTVEFGGVADRPVVCVRVKPEPNKK